MDIVLVSQTTGLPASFGLIFLPLHGHAIARLDVARIAGKGVRPFILLVRDAHTAGSRDDTSRKRSRLGRFVYDHIGHNYHSCKHSHNDACDCPVAYDLAPSCLRFSTRG